MDQSLPKTSAKRSGSRTRRKEPLPPREFDPDDMLRPKEERFVDLLFECNFKVATAYKAAGYSARSAYVHAYSKVKQPHIRAAIARRQARLRNGSD